MRLKLSILLISVAIVSGAFALNSTFKVATGFTSHYLCSQFFVLKRDPQKVFDSEIKDRHFLFPTIKFLVSPKDNLVSSAAFGFWGKSYALYRDGLGCINTSESEIVKLKSEGENLSWNVNLSKGETYYPVDIEPTIQAILEKTIEQGKANKGENTQALIVVKDGKIVAEAYDQEFNSSSPFLGWSMTKTIVALGVGMLVDDGLLSLDKNTWSGWAKDDPRSQIKLRQLLNMTSGLEFNEKYAPFSDVVEMLYNSNNMGEFAASRKLRDKIGEKFYYSSGTSNIVANILQESLGGDAHKVIDFFENRLFKPLGLDSAFIEFDSSGNVVASSYMFASLRDWTRIGELVLNKGLWNGKQLVSKKWIDFMTTPTKASEKNEFGAHIWLNSDSKNGRQYPKLTDKLIQFHGYGKNTVNIIPEKKLIISRVGATIGEKWDIESFVHKVETALN